MSSEGSSEAATSAQAVQGEIVGCACPECMQMVLGIMTEFGDLLYEEHGCKLADKLTAEAMEQSKDKAAHRLTKKAESESK